MNYQIIKTPHLPTGKVSHIACGKIEHNLKKMLLQYVDSILETETEQSVEYSLQNHADLALCPLTDGKILLSPNQKSLNRELQELGFYVIIADKIKSPYPDDCLLNFIETEQYSIYNSKIHYKSTNANKCHILTQQGYVKCTTVPLTETAIITDDPGIAAIANKQGIDVCIVSQGDVLLPGYKNGFIGGCCGKISANMLAFCGAMESHSDFKKMEAFLNKYCIEYVNLSDSQLTDVGSLIPLTQRKEL